MAKKLKLGIDLINAIKELVSGLPTNGVIGYDDNGTIPGGFEEIKFTTHSVNSTSVVSNNKTYYIEIGNLVIVNVIDLLVNQAVTGTTAIMSGLPAPASDAPFMLLSMQGNTARFHVTTSGQIIIWYTTMLGNSGEYWYGTMSYLKA